MSLMVLFEGWKCQVSVLDVEICMRGCLKFRKLMIEKSGWCPYQNSLTLAGFCQFQLRADFLNDVPMGYFPEGELPTLLG